MSLNPVLRMLAPVAGVSNRNFIRVCLKEAKHAVENRLFPKLANHSIIAVAVDSGSLLKMHNNSDLLPGCCALTEERLLIW